MKLTIEDLDRIERTNPIRFDECFDKMVCRIIGNKHSKNIQNYWITYKDKDEYEDKNQRIWTANFCDLCVRRNRRDFPHNLIVKLTKKEIFYLQLME